MYESPSPAPRCASRTVAAGLAASLSARSSDRDRDRRLAAWLPTKAPSARFRVGGVSPSSCSSGGCRPSSGGSRCRRWRAVNCAWSRSTFRPGAKGPEVHLPRGLRGRVVAQGLKVDRLQAQLAPGRRRHRLPPLEGRQPPPLEQELGLTLATRDRADGAFVEAGRQGVGLDLGHEAVPIGLLQGLLQRFGLRNEGQAIGFHTCTAYACLSQTANTLSVDHEPAQGKSSTAQPGLKGGDGEAERVRGDCPSNNPAEGQRRRDQRQCGGHLRRPSLVWYGGEHQVLRVHW